MTLNVVGVYSLIQNRPLKRDLAALAPYATCALAFGSLVALFVFRASILAQTTEA